MKEYFDKSIFKRKAKMIYFDIYLPRLSILGRGQGKGVWCQEEQKQKGVEGKGKRKMQEGNSLRSSKRNLIKLYNRYIEKL